MHGRDWSEIRAWRRQTRDHLIARRAVLSPDERRALGEQACARLEAAVDLRAFRSLGFCWPIRGEFDARPLAERHRASGGVIALPVVIGKSEPLEFWRWSPGTPMQTGIWNIPIPKMRELVIPEVLIAPLVGFDAAGYRLGYGGGYFDRTLAACSPRPFAIGLGCEESRLDTIHPQSHDIPMDMIVTELAAHTARPAS